METTWTSESTQIAKGHRLCHSEQNFCPGKTSVSNKSLRLLSHIPSRLLNTISTPLHPSATVPPHHYPLRRVDPVCSHRHDQADGCQREPARVLSFFTLLHSQRSIEIPQGRGRLALSSYRNVSIYARASPFSQKNSGRRVLLSILKHSACDASAYRPTPNTGSDSRYRMADTAQQAPDHIS